MAKDLFGDIPEQLPPQKRKEVARGYAAPPGTGPAGETCGSCLFRAVKQLSKRYYKCSLMQHRWTGGTKTDIRLKSPACIKWAQRRDVTSG